MKQLLLVRHAKAQIGEQGQLDFDRILSERGKKDALDMGHRIHHNGFKPDLIITSPAKRTLKTAKLMASKIKYDEHKIEFDQSIYDADLSTMLSLIRNTPDDVKQLMLVGHNPTFTSLIGYLSDSLIEHMPTGGSALIEFNIQSWNQIAQHIGGLVWFDFPKSAV